MITNQVMRINIDMDETPFHFSHFLLHHQFLIYRYKKVIVQSVNNLSV